MTTETALDRSTPPPPGPLRPFHFPEIERLELSNGVPVLFARSPGVGVATMQVLVQAGGVWEDRERAGLSSLTASLLETGAGGRTGLEIAEEIERLGLQMGTGSSWDAAHVTLTGLTSRMSAATQVAADLVRHPAFPEREVERLRQEQLAGILQRRAEPRGLANEMASRFIFAEDSPFSRPLSGTEQTVQGLTRSDVLEYHAARFTPRAAAVVVAGDLVVDDARGLAEEAFGGWAGGTPEPARASARPRSGSGEIVIVDRPGSVQSEIRVGHVGVARDTPDFFPVMVMNTILGGAFSSRLNMNLRERHGFTYGVSSSFVMRRQPGPFLVSTAVQSEVTAAALTEIHKEIRGIRSAPVSEAELQDARNYLAGVFPLRLETTDGLASRLAEIAIYDLPLDYFEGYRQRIVEITREQVQRAAAEHIHPDRAVSVVVGDAAAIRSSLEALEIAPVRVVGLDDPA